VLVLVLLIMAAIIYYRSLPDNNEASKFRVKSNSVEDQMDMGKMYGSNMDDELANNPLYLPNTKKPW